MAEKVKGKKAKTLSKKSSPRIKKPGTDEAVRSSSTAERKKVGRSKLTSQDKEKRSVEQASAELVASLVEASLPLPLPLPPLEHKFTSQVEPANEPSALILPKPQSKPEVEPEVLQIKLSRALIRKLKDQAADEGISLEEFVTELLAESVVLRAWEIVERKSQMKGNSGGNSQPMGNNRGNNGNSAGPNNSGRGGNRGNKGHRGMNPMRYQAIMEDKASFLEYVRSQERKGR